METIYPRNGDIVQLKNGDYAIIISDNLGIKKCQELGFIGVKVKSHGKEFFVNSQEITILSGKQIREIFIKEKIEPI